MYSRQKMIIVGELLKSYDDFDNRLYYVDAVDPRSGHTYTQVKSSIRLGKNKAKWYAKHVGRKDKYTPEDLSKATEFIKQQHRDFVNSELLKFNCQINDFPVTVSTSPNINSDESNTN